MAFDFSISAKTLTRIFGAVLTYKQGATQADFPIDIQHEIEVLDPETGVAQVVSVAGFTRADFPFTGVKKGDQILEGNKAWKVTKVLEQDGVNYTVEIGK